MHRSSPPPAMPRHGSTVVAAGYLLATLTSLAVSACGGSDGSSSAPVATGGSAGSAPHDASDDSSPGVDAESDGPDGSDSADVSEAGIPDGAPDSPADHESEDATEAGTCSPGTDCLTRRYYLLVFNPVLEAQGGQRLIAYRGWNDPDVLVGDYVADVLHASHGTMRYVEAGRAEVDAWPVKEDGFQYTDEAFLACLSDVTQCHKPGQADGFGYAIDYPAMLEAWGVCDKVNSGEIDELWAFGAPFMGMWEAVQAGPGAIETNGPVVAGSSCQRVVDIMGFSYERHVAEMLEDLGHRAEGTLRHVYAGSGAWELFSRYDANFPGGAHCGNVHWAPNSSADYDWGNAATVQSQCDDWYGYPNLTGAAAPISCTAWQCDARQHKVWWMLHFPHAAGAGPDGKLLSWWAYLAGMGI